jgi:hypothetical protein
MLIAASMIAIDFSDINRFLALLNRCDGSVLCFGKNDKGQLGLGVVKSTYGAGANEMSTLAPIAFTFPLGPAQCQARLTSITTTPTEIGLVFRPWVTFYVIPIASSELYYVFSAVTVTPATAKVTVDISPYEIPFSVVVGELFLTKV